MKKLFLIGAVMFALSITITKAQSTNNEVRTVPTTQVQAQPITGGNATLATDNKTATSTPSAHPSCGGKEKMKCCKGKEAKKCCAVKKEEGTKKEDKPQN